MNNSEVLYTDQLEAPIPGTPPTNTLRVYVEEVKGFSFFSFKDDTGMVRKLVRDSIFVGKNVGGTTIPINSAVHATGSSDGVPTLGLAQANSTATMPCIGIAIEAIPNNTFGRVMQVGLIENTDTHLVAPGTVFWVSTTTAGSFQITAPIWPNIRQEMGTILTQDAVIGTSQVITHEPFNDAVINHEGLLNLTVGDPHTQYLLANGSRAMTANMSMGNFYITNVSSGTSNTSVVNKSYVDAKSTVFGYVTLMAGSAMVTTTTPTVMNQWETSTNKNNYISLNFTDGGSEGAQWIVDFPADWNATAPVIFTPVWTAAEGSGTVNFTVAGKLFPDDAALDTALTNVSYSIDTLITAGDVHVGPATTGAAITSVGTGGNTAIIRVVRDSATDTLSGTAQLLGLRVKYIRTLA